mgnify:CR=1 FL=1
MGSWGYCNSPRENCFLCGRKNDWRKNLPRKGLEKKRKTSQYFSLAFVPKTPPPLRLEEEEEEEKEDLRMEGFARRRGYRVTRSRSMVSGGGGVFLFLPQLSFYRTFGLDAFAKVRKRRKTCRAEEREREREREDASMNDERVPISLPRSRVPRARRSFFLSF